LSELNDIIEVYQIQDFFINRGCRHA